MYKKTIVFTDYDGNTRTEDFYFNLNKAEVMEMELGISGGMRKMLEKIMAEQNFSRIIEIFKGFILKSYGEKSSDGRRFIKNRELTESFEQTEAYSKLFMELATNADEAANFINGILPKDLDGTDKPSDSSSVKAVIQ